MLKVGEARQDHNLVFCASVGTPLDAANARRAFRQITKNVGSEPTGRPANCVTRSSPS
jgi:hypothetical protein